MKTKSNLLKTVSFLSIGTLFSLNSFAQPAYGTPNSNAGNHPWTNNGHHHGNGNGGSTGSGSSTGSDNGTIGSGSSETPQPTTNRTSSFNNLNVTVGELYSLTLSNENATILLDDETKFEKGSKSEPITMTIFSSRKYAIKAQVSSDVFNGVADNTTVNTDNVNLLVTKTSGNTEATATGRTNKSLKSTESEQIASSSRATKADIFSLVYEIPAEKTSAFLSQYGKTLSTQITYTLLPL